MAETLCAAGTAAGDARAVVARLFTFVGPGLALDAHFAAGNFIGDALTGRPVVVRGDGSSVRSYLYAGNLTRWLLALLVRGAPGRAYNVGSSEEVTITGLAQQVASLAVPPTTVQVQQQPRRDASAHVYVPVIERTRRELGLSVRTPLPEALARTLAWHRSRP